MQGKEKGKSLIDPPTTRGSLVYPSTMKRSNLPPELCKTGQITPRAVLDGSFATVTTVFAAVTVVLSFSF
jgi:hypothetical protein